MSSDEEGHRWMACMYVCMYVCMWYCSFFLQLKYTSGLIHPTCHPTSSYLDANHHHHHSPPTHICGRASSYIPTTQPSYIIITSSCIHTSTTVYRCKRGKRQKTHTYSHTTYIPTYLHTIKSSRRFTHMYFAQTHVCK